MWWVGPRTSYPYDHRWDETWTSSIGKVEILTKLFASIMLLDFEEMCSTVPFAALVIVNMDQHRAVEENICFFIFIILFFIFNVLRD